MSRYRGILVVAIAVTCALAGVAPVLAAPADGEIGQSVFREELDDVVELPIDLPKGAEATLSVTGGTYERKISIVDTDDDGEVVVRLDTHAERTGHGAGYTAAPPDRVLTRNERMEGMTTGNHMLELSIDGVHHDTSLLRIVEGEMRSARTIAAPGDLNVTDGAPFESLPAVGSVAAGDLGVVAFDADGLTGPMNVENPPGENLVYADPSTPGEQTRHTVQIDAGDRNVTFNTARITYATADGATPGRLTGVNVQRVSVDSDGDGRADRELTSSVAGTAVREAGTMTVSFDDRHTLGANETLYLEYDGLTNPTTDGTYSVSVTVGDYTQTGEVAYGPAGDGVFGNGVDVTVENDAGTIVDPMPFEYVLDGEDDTLYVTLPTDEPSTMDVGLTKPNPIDGTTDSLSTTVEVVERSVSFDDHDLEDGELTVFGSTTLAPGSDVELYIHAENQFTSTLYDVRAVVDERRQFRTTVDVSDLQDGTAVRVTPQSDDLSDSTYQFTLSADDS
ncbi:DUF7827 domain-containing protein [Halorhabdus amylolytica]|uniref:DUF7827 domain-containing protein n=1 Tax=Halorhabdus amylolytica TaxID=2559573 RepID=UPI001B7D81F3|nr:hypothetical protein [Halorhabdus amylolytica]